MEMSLLTLNLHGWLEENQMDKFEKIAEFIYKNEIDIIAFQEVNQHKDKELTYDNIRIDNPSLIIKNFVFQPSLCQSIFKHLQPNFRRHFNSCFLQLQINNNILNSTNLFQCLFHSLLAAKTSHSFDSKFFNHRILIYI